MIPLIASLIPLVGNVLDKVLPNTAEREKAKAEIALRLAENETELLKLFAEIDKGQLEINKVEAANSSLFVAGWRPFIGWSSGLGVVYALLVRPIFQDILAAAHSTVVLPHLDTSVLMGLVSTLLGMGTLRMVEKLKGVERSNMQEL